MDEMTDEVDARIRALGQLTAHAGAQEAARALVVALEAPENRLAAAKTPARQRRGFTRRRWIWTGSLIALAGLGVAVPAAALSSWLARTGEFGDPQTSTEVDETEWILLGADDAPQVVVEAYPDYLTLPDGVPAEAAIANVSGIFDRLNTESAGQGIFQEGLLTQTYEGFAICAWTGDWLTAQNASDSAREQLAVDWLSDTDNFRTTVASDGGGVTDRLLSFAAGARDGDVTLVETAYTEQNCDTRLGGGER
ncbi:hypothetical protein [Cryobacterium aureum]|uniref:hypothetical protein n=1 Tax=Cryobacterium aureum TaxID=995037 RepID=UPI000CF3E1FD|nr:hypothetical protein [Cryobacterium aureum]